MKTTEEFLRSMIGDLVFQVAHLRARVAELEAEVSGYAMHDTFRQASATERRGRCVGQS